MTLDQLKQLFTNPGQEHLYTPKLRSHTPRKDDAFDYKFYTLDNCQELLEEIKRRKSLGEAIDVRYLVDKNNILWLAKEGKPSRTIPRHKDMGINCKAAGNLYFDYETLDLVRLNHSSGDFEPDVNSLMWPLAILAAKAVPTRPEVIVDIILQDGNQQITLTKTEISDATSHLSINQDDLSLANTDIDVVHREFEGTKKRRYSLFEKGSERNNLAPLPLFPLQV